MSQLRWTLLILGVVFIAALTWWERRRPRQAFAPRLREASSSRSSHIELHRVTSPDGAPAAEPWIGESGLADVVLSDGALANAPEARAPDAAANGHAQQQPGPLDELPTLVVADPEERLAFEAAWNETLPEPKLIDPEADAAVELLEPMPAASPSECGLEPESAPPSDPEPEITSAEGIGRVKIIEPAPLGESGAPVEPLVEWPPEESRRILALRLVAPPAERFPGRSLRLALAAEGFLLGKFSIFHKPDESNHAVLSAASLTRPGAFDLETMDSQRYSGLSLFAVLPGEKTPPQAFEELLAAARNLNERLQGALQDERGSPLTALRVAGLRESLRAEAAIPSGASGE
jgi:cell division protein ZipA